MGVEAMVSRLSPHTLATLSDHIPLRVQIDALQTSTSSLWSSQSFANYTVNGTVAGLYKNADNFSYVRFYGAGHEVPAYEYGDLARGQAALQMFEQIMMGEDLVPT